MAALPNTRLTLADLSKYLDPNGTVGPVVELLAQRNESLYDPMWQAGNLPTGHQFSQRMALPTAQLRDYNEGVLPSKSAVSQQVEGMSIIEAWSEVDAAEANLNGEQSAFRAKEDIGFIESLEQTFTRLMFYGNSSVNPKEFNGFARRVDQASRPQFLNAGGTGGGAVYTSIYLAEWGDNLFGIYPKGSQGGLQNIDHGRQIIQFSDGKRMSALVSQYIWNCGLVLRHPNSLIRIGNIDVAALRARTGTQLATAATNIIYKMIDAPYILPKSGAGRPVFYCNRTVHAALSKLAVDRSQNVFSIRDAATQFGTAQKWTYCMDIPIRCVDQILNTEAEVV